MTKTHAQLAKERLVPRKEIRLVTLARQRADKLARTCPCGFVGKTRGGLSIHQNSCKSLPGILARLGPDPTL